MREKTQSADASFEEIYKQLKKLKVWSEEGRLKRGWSAKCPALGIARLVLAIHFQCCWDGKITWSSLFNCLTVTARKGKKA